MNSTPTIQLAPTELPSVILIGNLLSNLDEATQARVLEKPFMKCPLVMATEPRAKRIQEKLMNCAHFDLDQAKFIRIKITQGRTKLGPMGYVNNFGYTRISIATREFTQSHLVYLLFTGNLPDNNRQIDHIDGNTLNDHPLNLRIVSNTLNSRNRRMNTNNSSGYTGVTWHRGTKKWRSLGFVYGAPIHLGLFNTQEEAYTARQAWIKAHPELGFTTRHGT